MATSRVSPLLRLLSRYSDGVAGRMSLISARRKLSENSPIIQKNNENGNDHINCAALESGVTKYYCNRNPRSLELLGMAEKPRGFATKKERVDYYHRYD